LQLACAHVDRCCSAAWSFGAFSDWTAAASAASCVAVGVVPGLNPDFFSAAAYEPNAPARVSMSPRIADGAAPAAFLMMFASAWRLVVPDALCACSACETFVPSASSCVQFLAEPKDEDDDEDEEDDEEDDDVEEEDELVVDPSESAVVVGGADDLLLPQPAAATARTRIETTAKAVLMAALPCRCVESNLLLRPGVV
jgi:hypothetical protein